MSDAEVRLYVVALLAGGYLATWRAIAHPAAPAAVVASAPPAVVWLDGLQRDQQPAVAIPRGWQLASRAPPSAPRLARGAPGRPLRVRTRSS